MKRCKTHLVCVCLLFLAAGPAYCQRVALGVDLGETSDKFGALSAQTSPVIEANGQVTILQGKPKQGSPSIVAGGEADFPTDTTNHAKEYSVFGGARFQFGHLTFGLDGQIRKIILPAANVNNQFFNRDNMELFEIPLSVKYAFGSSKRAFIEARGWPEFSPRFHATTSTVVLPHPSFDHAYFVRGSVGYNFGKWYAKASYETRYFKFSNNSYNPNGLYNWRTDVVSGGVGVVF